MQTIVLIAFNALTHKSALPKRIQFYSSDVDGLFYFIVLYLLIKRKELFYMTVN